MDYEWKDCGLLAWTTTFGRTLWLLLAFLDVVTVTFFLAWTLLWVLVGRPMRRRNSSTDFPQPRHDQLLNPCGPMFTVDG